MTYEEENFVLDSLSELKNYNQKVDEILQKEKENNIMLKQIIKVINTYISRHHQENNDDFNRNVLANMISGILDIKR